ncbi:DNA-binding protein [Sporosalibacterium faouarense]|uniref:DNA-binding protein n=1 Tax=Sporosalibacterium faouarense TaxID=516123 RepID=UPI00141C4E55|nr:DNA-binding protein [Sporosalibacterium faouarense]MTI47562.1 DNA-binding protein [Bacillota bacterium]
MKRQKIIELLKAETMESSEVVKFLGISRQRLSDMNRTGKLNSIKKGIYLKKDVEDRKKIQNVLRKKFGPKN